MNSDIIFFTIAGANDKGAARLMIDSLRTFGGDLANVPFWVFAIDPEPAQSLEGEYTRVLSLTLPNPVAAYQFGYKVAACARAEELAPAGTRSLAWIDPSCLVVQPPGFFMLDAGLDAAFRPVHIRNVGLPPSEPLDAFWQGIVTAVGVNDISTTITSFVDDQLLRTYFNSHAFAIHPTLGLMQRWYELFQQLVGDASFQAKACADELHQVFLFQVLLSTLVATTIDPVRIRILPPTYNYPYHLQDMIPTDRRLTALNETVCFAYEDCSIHPNQISGIDLHEPLRSWLATRVPE
jgi:hypothetical protein